LRLVVIGASAGGIDAVLRILKGLPAGFPAPILAVIHLSPQGGSFLPMIFNGPMTLPVRYARDMETMKPGQVYIAPPDRHLIVDRKTLRVVHGFKENLARPAIDPLFRSASQAFLKLAIGVLLSGTLDDGTAGLLSIKMRGGTAIVQDPEEARFPEMPANALRYVPVDHVLPLDSIPPMLVSLTSGKQRKKN
jgi:two-component system chemotaxis response regulator CheB